MTLQKEKIQELKNQGLTYQQIADKFGLTKQRN
jgi:orotate phosphoribosyltransferase-like protein